MKGVFGSTLILKLVLCKVWKKKKTNKASGDQRVSDNEKDEYCDCLIDFLCESFIINYNDMRIWKTNLQKFNEESLKVKNVI